MYVHLTSMGAIISTIRRIYLVVVVDDAHVVKR